MTSILAKVTAIEKRGDYYQVIVQIGPKYRLDWPIMNIGKDVSERLLSLTRRQATQRQSRWASCQIFAIRSPSK
jgi:hypothetical protein